MVGETSPVNAPSASWYMFWAPRATVEPRSVVATAVSEMKGGQTTLSTPSMASRPSIIADASAVASSTVVFIFQLPATMGVGIVLRALQGDPWSLPGRWTILLQPTPSSL